MGTPTITLQTFNNGDTDYVAKLNNNAGIIQQWLNTLQSGMQGSGSAAVSIATLLQGLFGTATAALIGAGSFAASTSGTNLLVQPGYAWYPQGLAVVQLTSAATLAFAGQAAGTYYINVNGSGTPAISGGQTAASLFSVAWTGSAFGAVTQIAYNFLNSAQQTDALIKGATVYSTLGDRFAAIEGELEPATDSTLGLVKVDGTTITVAGDGTISVAASESMANPMTAEGDLVVGGTVTGGVAAPTRLGAGTSGYVLTSQGPGVEPVWSEPGTSANATEIQGVAVSATTPTAGQLLAYESGEWQPTAPPYDMAFYSGGTFSNNQTLMEINVVRSFAIPVNCAGSVAKLDVATTGAITFAIAKNGASIGTINFGSGAVTGTFTLTGGATFVSGDQIVISAPATADATAAGLSVTFLGSRNA